MKREELLAHLRELHDELSSAEGADEETRGLLQQITTDINCLLDDKDDDPEDSLTLGDRLRDMAREFDVRHPRISDLIERVSDGLASMGI